MLEISDHSGPPLQMPWKRGIAVGRAYDLLRTDLIEHLRLLQREIGYGYCRFHALFHDDMGVVSRGSDGQLLFRWHHIDKIYDSLLELGLRPFVELNPMPAALASGKQKMFHYAMNVTPPASYEEWGQLVESFARHCIERYGLREVRQWYFEVWNEPNLAGFWSGTQDEYWQLYEASARAL
jgi:xylan 1,4-beta-xylosidase